MPSDLGVTSAFWELLLESVMQSEVQPLRPAEALRLFVHLDTELRAQEEVLVLRRCIWTRAVPLTPRGWGGVGGGRLGEGQRWEEQGSEGEG